MPFRRPCASSWMYRCHLPRLPYSFSLCDVTALRAVARSLAPKRDGLIGATLVRVVVVAHKIFAALREREIKCAAPGQGELYARVWCNLRTHLKFSSCM